MSPPSTNSPGVNPQSTPGFQSEYPTTAEELHRAQLEDKLEQLLQSLLEVGICTSDVQENAREGGRTGRGEPLGPGGLVGKKINESIEHMAELYELNANMASEIPIPVEVITQVDQGTNPDRWLRSFVERAAHENMYTNGILSNVNQYRSLLQSQLADYFPDLYQELNKNSDESTPSDEKTINKGTQPNP
ncbi:hypothetical protein MJO29_008997 [Puccinia striiformis f. sp. tritici]|nr:hypothetical protein Pst134EA_017811 [Puccinia striiformis f. sp. tritici]KAH9461509.1 hypothetical protein Pst134EA_017811 [Puccinia striiformis f. sp. tritici]KAI7950323.1 hypothetical protein MJO29_008997 [Puccinia striiformis f. sp. tritici]KAI9615874.1 hypothetical protein H4Q26_011125 [Puccinia striiformis f. sp. tritici PST-130]